MDLSSFPNPYDFANPVSEEGLFVGRSKQLEEIAYYLDHGKTATRPINIAIIGPRASGKTSLLNMTEIEAARRGYCTVRVDLDEGDMRGELAFFHKLFDGLLTAACELGAFEGTRGRTYDTYLDMVNAYVVPGDKTFCPFLFPIQYAKALGGGHPDASVSDNSLKTDIRRIRSELNRPISILFDEGNVVASNRILLEKLRNIFMNVPGYMLVLTGTPELFPAMNEVFSPIIRQFKKVTVGNFDDPGETEQCVRKPLERLGIWAEIVFDFGEKQNVKEIHELAGGRPYEVQLVCHVLFRRVQTKRASKMKLDLSVIEEVRKELETSQDLASRPVLSAVRSLKRGDLRALNVLCVCDGKATPDELWSIVYVVHGDGIGSRDFFDERIGRLKQKGILTDLNGRLKFAGDEFDKIYTKYFAREREVSLNFPDWPIVVFWYVNIDQLLDEVEGLSLITRYPGTVVGPDLPKLAAQLSTEAPGHDVFVEAPQIVRDLYNLMLRYRWKETLTILRVQLSLPWIRAESFYYAEDPNDIAPIDEAVRRLDGPSSRAVQLGGGLEVEKLHLPVAPAETLIRKAEQTANERLRTELATDHAERMAREYVKNSNLTEALFHAVLSTKYNPLPADPVVANNIGYVFMAANNLQMAKREIDHAIQTNESAGTTNNPHYALTIYNRAVLAARQNELEEALTKIRTCISLVGPLPEEARTMLCLFVPVLREGRIEFVEVRDNPDLFQVAKEAEASIGAVTPKPQTLNP